MPRQSNGDHPLYLVREFLNTTSDWTTVTWVEGPLVVTSRSRIVEGAEAPGLAYTVSGLTVWVSKSPFDETKVVVEVEALALEDAADALIRIEKGDVGATRAQVALYDQAQDAFTPIAEFLHDGQGPRGFSLDLSAFYALPAATAHVGPAAPELERKVFAFYYPWYGNPRGPSRQWVHWEGTATSPSGEETIRASTHYPLLGAYDSADGRVISAHMAMAKEAGIDGFVVSWWGPGGFEDRRMRALLAAAERSGMSLSIYYESVRELSQNDIVAEFTAVVQAYADHPAFLKDSGRPVLFVYCVPCLQGRGPSFWLEVRRAVQARVGPLVLLGDIIGDANPGRYSHVFDGFHSYIYLEEDLGPVFSEAEETLELGLSSSMEAESAFSSAYVGGTIPVDRKLVSLTVTPGIHFVGDPSPLLDRENGARYAAHWSLAIETGVSSVLITSWNEWHEGTEIEPSREYGFDYLQLTRQSVQAYKQTVLPFPQAGISATVRGFAIDASGGGNGTLGIAAVGEAPLVIATVKVEAIEGASEPDLVGDFYTYIREERADLVSVVIPSVGGELEVLIKFQAESLVALLEIHPTAYDPNGNRQELLVRTTTPDVGTLLAQLEALETLVDTLQTQTRDLATQLVGQLLVWQLVAAGALTWSVVASVLLLRKKKV